MITTRIPAFITVGARDVPYGSARFSGHTVDLVHSSVRPCIARIVGVTFRFGVTVDGLTVGLVEEHVEPFGRITIGPSADGDGFEWVVVDIDGEHGRPNSQVWLATERVAEFLVDVALSRLLPADGGEFEVERPPAPRRVMRRRTDGGAA